MNPAEMVMGDEQGQRSPVVLAIIRRFRSTQISDTTPASRRATRDNYVPNIVLPPTPTILQIASLLDRTLSQFLQARQTLPPMEKFESEIEAIKLLNLVVRDVEAIIELARLDLVLVPAANVLARVVFEVAVKAAWMVTPDDPFEREVRWLTHLEEEERMHGRIAGKVTRLGGNPANFEKHRDTIKRFRTGIVRLLPAGYSPLPGNPSVEQMLDDIGQKQVYSIYTLLCAYVHGGHASTSLYRRNLGTLKEDGEFIEPESWHLALWTSWKNLELICPYVLERLGATGHDFIRDAHEIETALGRLSSETTNKTIVM